MSSPCCRLCCASLPCARRWVHLNWGDDGLMRLFRRFWDSLEPGVCVCVGGGGATA
jgi:hypothetical protein